VAPPPDELDAHWNASTTNSAALAVARELEFWAIMDLTRSGEANASGLPGRAAAAKARTILFTTFMPLYGDQAYC